MSTPSPSPKFHITSVPGDHPATAAFRAAQLAHWENDTSEIGRAIREGLRAQEGMPLDQISSGPLSFSGSRMPFVRPQMSHMEPLAKALGLDKDGGWADVWQTMDKHRKRLCKLVWQTLEWHDEANAGNTFTYCFCTKYLPRVIAAAIAEPSPSLAASPYDLILRGACNTPLVQYYLRSRPDQAIDLRNTYYKKCFEVVKTPLSTNDFVLQVVPHFLVAHTCIAAYVGSPLSTAAQKAPPLPFPFRVCLELNGACRPVWEMIKANQVRCGRGEFYPWAGNIFSNTLVFSSGLFKEDIFDMIPDVLEAHHSPSGFDHLACRGVGIPAENIAPELSNVVTGMDTLECFERDPKKMKAWSRCKVVMYCCIEHQKHDWLFRHKPMCQKIVWDEL